MRKKRKSYTPILIGLLIIAAFFLGSLTTKVAYLEKNILSAQSTQPSPSQALPQPKAVTKEAIKRWAKDLRLNTGNFNKCLDTEKHKSAIDEDQQFGQTAGVNGTPTFFINGTMLVGAQPFQAFKTIIDQELQGAYNNPNSPTLPPKISVDNGHLPGLGNKNAKVTIIEFSDFECPFCRRFFTETSPQIKKEYVDTGKVVMYYRHYPLPFHPLAQPFALASECANEQGKFWEFHDKIFKEQG